MIFKHKFTYFFAVVIVLSTNAFGNSVNQESFRLLPTPTGVANDISKYGQNVDIDGNRAIISAIDANIHGVAFIMDFYDGEWHETATLEPPESGHDETDFGVSVSISGDWAAVGIENEMLTNFDDGAVMLYKLNGSQWEFVQKLKASDYDINNNSRPNCFGCSLSISNNKLVVGAYTDSEPNTYYGAIYVFHYRNNQWNEVQKIYASQGAPNDKFGQSLDIKDERIVVGAAGWNQSANPNGTVYVYQYNALFWQESAILTASDAGIDQKFGTSVSLTNNRIIVGASGAKNDVDEVTGAAYIFDLNGATWTETKKILPSDSHTINQFGKQVSIDGNQVFIAAKDTNFPNRTGYVYAFKLENSLWQENQKLTATATINFGSSIAQSADNLIIGTEYYSNTTSSLSGAAYTYKLVQNIWDSEVQLTAKESSAGDLYGSSVDFYGDYAVVGAPNDYTNGESLGSVYIYYFSGGNWTEVQKIIPVDDDSFTKYGYTVKLYENFLFVGSHQYDDNGAVYVYKKDNGQWLEAQVLTPSDSTDNGDNFGFSFDVSEDTLMIGSHFNNPTGDFNGRSGAVYTYTLTNSVWVEDQKIVSLDLAYLDNFGYSVSLDGDIAMVGSNLDDTISGRNAGSVTVFRRINNTWAETAKLLPNDGESEMGFANLIQLQGNRALIGSSRSGSENGYAYVFEYDGADWIQTKKLIPSLPAFSNQYNSSIFLWNDTILIGAIFGESLGTNSGAVFQYEYNGIDWIENQIITQETPSFTGDGFGSALYMNDSHKIIGAYHSSIHGTYSGSVYIESAITDLVYKNSFESLTQ